MRIIMSQQVCIISQLHLSFSTHTLFNQLNFTLPFGQVSAVIGRNGLGKSLLFKLLHYPNTAKLPYSGQIVWNVQHAYLPQLHRLNAQTIAQALEIDHLHYAFQRIENATAEFEDYELVENCWDLPQQWQHILSQARLPTNLSFPVEQLSEGQKTKLALCCLFLKQDHYLLLDEPSNHLDTEARKWLVEAIQSHKAGVCIISHDRDLLSQVQHIYALSELGLQHIKGNYHDYFQHYQQQLNALSQSIQQEKRELKHLKQQQHEHLMKAQKRQRKGIQLKNSNSQAKILLDFKKEQAGQSFGKLKAQQTRQTEENQTYLQEKQVLLEKIKPQKFEFSCQTTRHGEILRINHLKLPYASVQDINFSVQAFEKIHLKGANGVGKSTLLKLIHDQKNEKNPEIFISAKSIYLDQNFSLLDDHLSVIENLTRFNGDILDVEWRNLLGQLRIRREKALLKLSHLSGGEKLKIALLAISYHQDNIDLLLLDEPENHLDIESKELLAQAIAQFQGAVILVSHDAFFVQQCKINEGYLLT